jgi:DNA primase catalytic subunit
MKIFTEEHLKAARYMPRDKRSRKAIAAYYRLARREYGRRAARDGHRCGRCTSGADARRRIKQLLPSDTPGPVWFKY